MKCYFLDPGLIRNIGHHAEFCRRICQELSVRGIETHIFGHKDIEPSLRAELGVTPLFRVSTYWETDGDHISGWLNAFDINTVITGEDLAQLPALTADDIVFVNSARPAQLAALAKWLPTLPATPTV